jgi:hypothetical protein
MCKTLAPQEGSGEHYHDSLPFANSGMSHSMNHGSLPFCNERYINPAGAGNRISTFSRQLDLSEVTVRAWLKRFNVYGLNGL